MFAFHQYFHSSFRARQGKVLEKMIQNILKQYGQCDQVPTSNTDRLSIVREIFGVTEFPSLDIDAMGVNSTNKRRSLFSCVQGMIQEAQLLRVRLLIS